MQAESVIRLIEAASQSEEEQVSHYMLRMLRKLAQHADGPVGKQRHYALESLQEQVTTLITGWALKDPNPEGYSAALREMATAEPLFVVAGGQLDEVEPKRVVDMAFETDVTGVSVTSAVSRLIEMKEAAWLLERVADNNKSALTQSLIGSTEQFEQLLRQLLDRYDQNVPLALSAYNAGMGRTRRKVARIYETTAYVSDIMTYYWRYQDNAVLQKTMARLVANIEAVTN